MSTQRSATPHLSGKNVNYPDEIPRATVEVDKYFVNHCLMTRPNKRALHLRHARAARDAIRQAIAHSDAHVSPEGESASGQLVNECCTCMAPCQPVSRSY